ncbi:winged helix-turn-helix domain-containing protein [Acidihalobacter ferrooxydans]|uniref:winged helix-turn-helix domain-containing protein n=1 Tax=Acidihalobacter ferrooxydans TaxID=1765967 RepID=UPI0026B9BA19
MGRTEPRIRILLGSIIAMGPGKADLLDAIQQTGSISAAARRMNMSYRRAWLLVDTMNQSFREPLVTTAAGGKGGGGANVTEFGRDMLARYRKMETRAQLAIADEISEFGEFLVDSVDH